MATVNVLDYKELYLKTAKDYLDSLSKSCNKLAYNPLDRKALTQLHISSHSLRSQSQVMGYISISSITSEIEKIARAVLEGKYNINTNIISVFKEVIMAINVLLSDVEKNNTKKNVDTLLEKLQGVSKR